MSLRALAVIPARGGSKGVAKKNVLPVGGKPLLVHAIDCAKESKSISRIVVSTDCPEIARMAEEEGVPVVLRPRELAEDQTPMPPVLLHALGAIEHKEGLEYDLIVLLQPTAPLRRGRDVDAVVAMFGEDSGLESVVSVCPMDELHPARMYRMEEGGWMASLNPDLEKFRRQDLPVVYYRNGAIYAMTRRLLVDEQKIMGVRKKAYVMPRSFMFNVDDERDIAIAESMMEFWKKSQA